MISRQPKIFKWFKTFKGKLLLAFFLAPSICFGGGRSRQIIGDGLKENDIAAINMNFDKADLDDGNSVHKSSTETIHGNKYFVDAVDFGSVTADTMTITKLTATTATITNLSTSSFLIGGISFGLVPVGAMLMWGSTTTLPAKWINADGTSYSTSTYSALFAVYGYVFGGSGANFNVPDYRGVFPKGAGTTDRTAGKDANGNFYSGTNGTYSTDMMQGHQIGAATGGTTYFGWTNDAGNRPSGAAIANNSMPYLDSTKQGNAAGWYPQSNGTNGTPRVGNTTEPQSLGINFIIYSGI